MRTIVVGCPVRQRAWILPHYLSALDLLIAPPDAEVLAHLVVQPGTDATEDIVRTWCATREWASWGRVTGAPAGLSRDAGAGHYDYAWLAGVRNVLATFAVGRGADLFSVDSDVLVSSWTLVRLDRRGLDVCAAAISNTAGVPVDHPACALNAQALPGADPSIAAAMRAGVCEVAMTGACCLYRARVLQAGVRWTAARGGEDFGFCAEARARGFRVYLDGSVRARHVMRPEDAPGAAAREPASAPEPITPRRWA